MNFDILNAVNQNNMRYAWWFYEAILLTHNMRLLYVFLRLLFNLVVGALKVVMSQLFIKQLFLASLLRLWPTANMQSTPHGGCEKQKGPPVGCLTFSICQSDWWHSKFSRRSFFEQSNKLFLRSKLSCSLHHFKSVTLTKLNSGVRRVPTLFQL